MPSRPENLKLFSFLKKRIEELKLQHKLGNTKMAKSQAFISWFLETHHTDYSIPFRSDGKRDGKIDAYSWVEVAASGKYLVINSKYSSKPGAKLTKEHYKEIDKFSFPFRKRRERNEFLIEYVKDELRPKYHKLYEAYDAGNVELIFITSHRRDKSRSPNRNYGPVKIFDIDDVYQTLSDDIDSAAPATLPLTLTEIGKPLYSKTEYSKAKIAVIFAKLSDFIKYMKGDEQRLLFARNVRVAISTGSSKINEAILNTYKTDSREFALSNNGVTIVCDKLKRTGRDLVLDNPRVVNGGQTLNTIRDEHKNKARVMTRIIEVGSATNNLSAGGKKKLSNDVARRTNEQNPIKKWDLVSNDDYQLELFRTFRTRGIFYDRRLGEFRKNSRRIKSFGMSGGPSIKLMTQLIASFKYKEPLLGPANAKFSVSKLFDDDQYEDIEWTERNVVYQLGLLYLICSDIYKDYSRSSAKGQITQHGNLFCFAIACCAIRKAGLRFGTNKLRRMLEVYKDLEAWEDSRGIWKKAVTSVIELADKEYRRAKDNHSGLTRNNFFKIDANIRPIFERKRIVPKDVVDKFTDIANI